MSESFRRDVSVGHDSCSIALTSRASAGCCEGLEPGSPEWLGGVERGEFLPIALDGDRGGTCVRVVLELPLDEDEQAEWVGRFAGRLEVDDGRLIVCGSTDFLDEQYFVDTDMVAELEVPPGSYRVDVYACFAGINGWGANPDGFVGPSGEPMGAWFRRTRPGEPFPLWLRLQCYEHPGHDPGHEADWSSLDAPGEYDEDEETSWVDFIVRLTRMDDLGEVPCAPLDAGGFVPVDVGRRVPERCPLGLKSNGGN